MRTVFFPFKRFAAAQASPMNETHAKARILAESATRCFLLLQRDKQAQTVLWRGIAAPRPIGIRFLFFSIRRWPLRVSAENFCTPTTACMIALSCQPSGQRPAAHPLR